MVASMALLVALLAPMASMVPSLDRLMIEPKSGAERADELTIKIDGERVGRLTHIIREERVDGFF